MTPTNLTVSPSGGTGTFNYQWYSSSSNANSGGTNLGSGSGAQTSSYTPSTSTNGTTYYYCVIGESGAGCGVTTPLNDAKVIVDKFSVSAGYTGGLGSGYYCGSGTISLTATVTPNGSYGYSWSGPNGFTSSIQDPTNPANNNGGTYIVSASDANCTVTGSTSVTVYPLMVVTTALTGCMFEDSAHVNVSVDSDMVIVTASNGTAPYTFASAPAGTELRDIVTSNQVNVYTVPANAGSYTFAASDAYGCSASSSINSLSGNPTNIPYTGLGVHGSETVTCFDNHSNTGFGKWLTFIDPSNNGILEIYDNNQDLGLVSVTVYKDKTSMHIQESGTGCPNTYESPMQRHYVLTSNATQPFAEPVTVRLYFTNTELDSLEKAEQADYNGLFCSTFGAVNSLNDLYLTKYDDPFVGEPGYTGYNGTGTTEDSLYTNNISGGNGGIYTVYGNLNQYNTGLAGRWLKTRWALTAFIRAHTRWGTISILFNLRLPRSRSYG